jgi:hypothetical protein
MNFADALGGDELSGAPSSSSKAHVTPSTSRPKHAHSAPPKSLAFGSEFEQENHAAWKGNRETDKILDNDKEDDDDDDEDTDTQEVENEQKESTTDAVSTSTKDDSDKTNSNEEDSRAGGGVKGLLRHGRAHSQPEISGSVLAALQKTHHANKANNLTGGISPRAITESLRTLLSSKALVRDTSTQTLSLMHTSNRSSQHVIGRRRSHEIRLSRGSRGKSLGGSLALFSETKVRAAAPLLGAKKLIEDALTAKEQQLEELKSSSNCKQARFMDQKRGQVQAVINSFSNELRWIESTIQAQEGQTRVLCRTTSDWASMMVQSAHHHEQHKLIRLVQQGVMVKKHSRKRWGCGFRFMAVDKCGLELRYVKNLEHAPMIFFDQANAFASRKGTRTRSSSSSSPSTSAPTPYSSTTSSTAVGYSYSPPARRPGSGTTNNSAGTPPVMSHRTGGVFKSPPMKVVKLAMVSKLLYGRDAIELGVELKVLSSQDGLRSSAFSAEQNVNVDSHADLVPRFVALQTEKEIGNVKTLFLEFPTEAQAEDFFLGLQATILRAQNRFGTTKFAEGKKGKNGE